MTRLTKRRLVALGVFFGSIAILFAWLIVFDVWLAQNWGLDATISRSMRDLHPLAVFAWGNFTGAIIWGLAAHFWWSNPGDKKLRG